MPSFAIGADDFLLDGRPFRILSGALHYFRVHPDLWADRIRSARLMGLNTIETYVAWNAHESRPGEFDFAGGLDLARFLDLVAAEGMHAIVRPGPYICAEWDNGGLPAWLFRDPEVGVRRDEPRFLAAIGRYFAAVLPLVACRQVEHGGPVILVQVENEYGAYGSDQGYLRALTDLTRAHGITVPLTSIDQPTDRMLADGTLPELHTTASFGSRALERLATLRRHQTTGPLMCAEFWDGWFDNWGAHHHTTPVEDAARELDALLSTGASVNVYMFHGGTNFGFTNGANDKGVYQPTVTSYDYDAPLDEAGHPTAKFWAFREVISRYAPVPGESPPRQSPPAPAFDCALSASVPLGEAIAGIVGLAAFHAHPGLPATDDIGHYSGFSLYRAEVGGRAAPAVLAFGEVRDRAQVFLDGAPVGVLSREAHERAIALPAGAAGCLELLVEDQGRVNYGDRLGERKGLIGPATLDGEELGGWRIAALDLARLDAVAGLLRARAAADPVRPLAGPVFARAVFDGVPAGTDLFLDTGTLGKGVVFVNGTNLGRYWSRGPQRTLVVPGPLVLDGPNEVIVFELHAIVDPTLRFVAGLDLGPTEA